MPNLEQEALHSAYEEKEAEKNVFEEVEEPISGDPQSGVHVDFKFLLAKTGDGSISDYLDHPLNAKKSEGMAQVLRGFTGIFGSLDYGLVDVGLGSLKIIQEKKGAVTREQSI